jgi:hypothetical protein
LGSLMANDRARLTICYHDISVRPASPVFITHLDIPARLDLASVSAVLRDNLLLIRHILYPMNVLCPASAHFTLNCEGR